MINFLRQIRKKLFFNGRLKKYSLYALGEIVLIVVGILIALYLNNWNINRVNDLKETRILIQLNEDYKDNLLQLEQKMGMRDQIIESATTILELINTNEELLADEVIPLLTIIVMDPTFDPIENDLMATGDISLIKNDSLRRILARWTSDVKQVQQLEIEWQKMRTEIFLPFLIEIGIARDFAHTAWKNPGKPVHILDGGIDAELQISKSSFQIDLNTNAIRKRMEDVVSIAINPNHVANLQSISLRMRILKILELIDEEIDLKNGGKV